jgi:hypothetical protein
MQGDMSMDGGNEQWFFNLKTMYFVSLNTA